MDTKRELWASAYRFYQEQCKTIDAGVADFSEYFTGLAMEIAEKGHGEDAEGAELWKGVYGMLEKRANGVNERG